MEITVKNIEELPSAARRLIPVLRAHGGVVALYGGMGAGKTTLTAALLRAMGSTDEVSSPTFALVNDYLVPGGEAAGSDGSGGAGLGGARHSGGAVVAGLGGSGGGHVYHFDFYRIDDIQEAFDLGYEEYFYSGELCLVEWPEKIEELLPDDTLRVHIDLLPDGSRRITI